MRFRVSYNYSVFWTALLQDVNLCVSGARQWLGTSQASPLHTHIVSLGLQRKYFPRQWSELLPWRQGCWSWWLSAHITLVVAKASLPHITGFHRHLMQPVLTRLGVEHSLDFPSLQLPHAHSCSCSVADRERTKVLHSEERRLGQGR